MTNKFKLNYQVLGLTDKYDSLGCTRLTNVCTIASQQAYEASESKDAGKDKSQVTRRHGDLFYRSSHSFDGVLISVGAVLNH